MPGPMMSAPISAQQIAQQKLQEQATQPSNKVGGSKFDGVMAEKAQMSQRMPGAAEGAQAQSRIHSQMLQKIGLGQQPTHAPAGNGHGNSMAKRSEAASFREEIRMLQSTVGPQQRGQNVAVKLVGDIEKGQKVMDRLITEGLSGRHFGNAELLALQAGMYKYTQE